MKSMMRILALSVEAKIGSRCSRPSLHDLDNFVTLTIFSLDVMIPEQGRFAIFAFGGRYGRGFESERLAG